LNVLENLSLGAFTRGKERREENLEKIFGIFPRLRERTKQLAGTLSGGEQQMLAIGRGLMAEPKLLNRKGAPLFGLIFAVANR
jgi:branched-chain amino acid transport system ATP-binding protein